MSKPQCWQEVPLATVAFGASALKVQTGLWRSSRPVIDTEKCISCYKCWLQCPDDSIATDDEGKVTGINLFFCKGCGICAKVCPADAIAIYPESEFSEEDREDGKTGADPGEVGAHVG